MARYPKNLALNFAFHKTLKLQYYGRMHYKCGKDNAPWDHFFLPWTRIVRAVYKTDKMLKSVSPQYPVRAGGNRVIRLTVDQEAVLQEQFNRWPRAPHTADVVLLAAETGLSEADVEAWYAIRLAQWRKEQGLGGNLGLH
ncbi:hypothetical protein KM043_007146 [Ampulex compressa]|nr:hypothetical protein KM043_007146 [Ampulex compressa]